MGVGEGAANQAFGPLQVVVFAGVIGSHLPIRRLDICWHHLRASQVFSERANAAFAYLPVKPRVYSLA
jgi:hypothetical protein